MYFEKYDNSKAEKELYRDIYSLIHELRNTKSKTKYNRLMADLGQLYYLADKSNMFDYPLVEDCIFRINDHYTEENRKKRNDKDYNKLLMDVNENLFFHMDIADLCNLFKEYDFEIDTRDYAKITDFAVIEKIAKDLMRDPDINLLDYYNKLCDKNHVIITQTPCEIDEGTVSFLSTRMPYIFLNLGNSIDDVATITHETAHLRHLFIEKNNHHFNDYTYIYGEVYSFYIQLITYKKLKDKHIYDKDIDIFFNSYLDRLSTYLISLNDSLDNIENDNYELYGDLKYCYGMLLALSYYDIYSKDPEKAKHLTNHFIEQSYKMETLDVLNNFGLNQDELLSGEVLKKYILKGRL